MLPGADPRVYDEVNDFQELTSTIEKSVFTTAIYVCLLML